MRHQYAQLIFVLSIFLFSLVSLDFFRLNSIEKNRAIVPPKANLSQVVSEIGRVLPGSTSNYFYKFYLKDSSAAANITTQTTDSSYISGATIKITNSSSFHCGDSGSDFTFVYNEPYYKLSCQEAGEMKLQISKSGYNTKNTSISHYQGEIPTIYLTKATPKPPPPPPPPPETIKDVKLPDKFSKTGASTDLSKVSDSASVPNLTLDTEKGTIVYKEAVDLSSSETKDKFKELDKYVKAEQTGVVGVDSTNLPSLNKKATITMKDLTFVKTPKILVDGKEDSSVVTNIKYEKGKLTFDVAHFSTFVASPTLEITSPTNNFEVKEKKLFLKGKVSDTAASVSAKLNNKDIGRIKVSSSSGEFSKEISLGDGQNKIVVTALALNGAKVAATVSGILLKGSNLLPFYATLVLLALIAGYGIIYSVRKMSKKLKKEDTQNTSNQSKNEPPKQTF